MGLVSKSSNCFRSLVKPALHVGKHSLGGVGCLTSLGSSGIAAGLTTTADCGDLVAQPAPSISGRISISASPRFTGDCILQLLLNCSLAGPFDLALFFGGPDGLRQ